MYIIEYTSEGSNVDCYRDVLRSSSIKAPFSYTYTSTPASPCLIWSLGTPYLGV